MKTFYPAKFCKITTSGVDLRQLQIGSPDYQYTLDTPDNSGLKLFVQIENHVDHKYMNSFYIGDETGYLNCKNSGDVFYRNCNTVISVKGHELLYKGKLPKSKMHIRWEKKDSIVYVNIGVTKNYLRESRSRLTTNSSFEQLVTSLILHFSTHLELLPFHAAAIYNNKSGYSTLFCGLPNTGKTTTSFKMSKSSEYDFLSEDIVFVDKNSLEIFPCPFTLNPKSPTRYKSARYFGGKLQAIVILKRGDSNSVLSDVGPDDLYHEILNMNCFEFTWLHDVNIRHLFHVGDADLQSVARGYVENQATICNSLKGIQVEGNNPELWAGMLSEKLSLM